MNERKRNWGSTDHARRQGEAAELEQLMRHILSLFSAGCLVYRDREVRGGGGVSTQSSRLKRLRANLAGAGEMAVA
jgi:hypothetical protein